MPKATKIKGGTTRVRNIVFTLNNYTDADITRLSELAEEYCGFLMYGREVGEEKKTPHLQGYAEFTSQRSLNKMRKLFACHVEPRKGTQEQAMTYCKKEDAHPFMHGTPSKQGSRSDIAELRDDIASGMSFKDLYEGHDAMWKYRASAKDYRYQLDLNDRSQRDVQVTVLYGDAGTGKTRQVYEQHPDVFCVPHPTTQLWWDGYAGQDVILLDDFYGWIKYSYLLRILDRYPLQMKTHGGFVIAKFTKVYITSNKGPSEWYTQGLTPALKRRLHTIECLDKKNDSEVGVIITPNF